MNRRKFFSTPGTLDWASASIILSTSREKSGKSKNSSQSHCPLQIPAMEMTSENAQCTQKIHKKFAGLMETWMMVPPCGRGSNVRYNLGACRRWNATGVMLTPSGVSVKLSNFPLENHHLYPEHFSFKNCRSSASERSDETVNSA